MGSSHETHLTPCHPSPHLGGTSVDEVLIECGATQQRLRKLPARVVVYLLLAAATPSRRPSAHRASVLSPNGTAARSTSASPTAPTTPTCMTLPKLSRHPAGSAGAAPTPMLRSCSSSPLAASSPPRAAPPHT
ncbi:transposase domain-containing protein [Streptomyces hygroscopicus]|uniref:transposase domain-containing protein n=1 Tax=Streptomyces hygroscopicus TaxID=1912 RepID=UPI0036B4C8C0